jgi:hypothetical protein
MPGAFNLPFGEVLNPDGTMKDEDGIRAALAAEGVDPARPSSPPAARASPPRSCAGAGAAGPHRRAL